MIIGLGNRKYKLIKDKKTLLQKRESFKYLVLDCSSTLKGPVYSIVRTEKMSSPKEKMTIEMVLGYGTLSDYYTYEDQETLISYEINKDSLLELYSIISNMYLYSTYNYCMIEEFKYTCILSLKISYVEDCVKKVYTYTYNDDDDVDIFHDFIKEVGYELYTSELFGYKNNLYLYESGLYEFSECASYDDIKYIGFHLRQSQSFCLLKYATYLRFCLLDSIEYSVRSYRRKDLYTFGDNSDDYITIDQCFELVLSFEFIVILSQHHLISKKEYTEIDENYIIRTEICTSDGYEYNVDSSSKELERYGYCLFKIIDNLLKYR